MVELNIYHLSLKLVCVFVKAKGMLMLLLFSIIVCQELDKAMENEELRILSEKVYVTLVLALLSICTS